MRQHVTVIGKQYVCGEPYCGQPATVILRQFEVGADAGDVILFCDDCWLGVRRQYAPITAHDAVQATAEAEALIAGSGDDDTGQFIVK